MFANTFLPYWESEKPRVAILFFFFIRGASLLNRDSLFFLFILFWYSTDLNRHDQNVHHRHTLLDALCVFTESTTKLVITRAWGNNRVPISISPRRVLTRFEQISAAAFVGELSEFFFFFLIFPLLELCTSPVGLFSPSPHVIVLSQLVGVVTLPCYCARTVGQQGVGGGMAGVL